MLPRYIDEFVMAQIEAEENLARLPDQTSRTLVRLLIETGLRSVDAMRLPLDPVTTDQAGAPYLRFRNHKLSREAVIPISQRLLAEIHAHSATSARASRRAVAVAVPAAVAERRRPAPARPEHSEPAAPPLA